MDVCRLMTDKLMCETSGSVNGLGEREVEVDFGGYKRLLSDKFTYVEDPQISYIYGNHSIARYKQFQGSKSYKGFLVSI